jgi:hypothetical protein
MSGRRFRTPAILAGSLVAAMGIGACAPLTGPHPPAPALHAAPAPASVIGFDPGEDYKLADYGQLVEYYERLAAASDRVDLTEIGRTTRGRPLLLLFISSPDNLRQLERWRSISQRLAKADDLTDEQARALAREGKVVVWIDAGLHSTEVAHSQFAPHLAYHMATDESEETRRVRDDVILLLMPVMNPDGHEIVVDWYREHVGEPWEMRPPEVYHEYVGHDINRDWYMFRQEESRAVGRVLYEEWFPQIVFNHHQTAPFPARIFIPPFADPVNPHIDPRVVRGVNLVGEHMANRFEMEGMPGVVSGVTFTMWWNGGMRTAPYFHNQIGILSEVGHASPTPRDHDPADFPETFARGLPTLEPTIRYPNPWRGGRASLGEAVRYHLVSSLGALDAAQKNREDFLYNFYQMGRDAIRSGRAGDPFAYLVALDEQHDPGEAVEMLTALRRGGVVVQRATAGFEAGGQRYPEGTYIIPAAQAFRAHVLDMLEPQDHPHRELYPGGPPEPPYGGLAGYTLSLQMGVTTVRVDTPFPVAAEPVDRVAPPPARVAGRGDVFLLSPRPSRVMTALHELAAAGATVERATAPFTADGARFDAGTLVVRSGSVAADEVVTAVERLGLTAHRLTRPPDAPLAPARPARVGIYRPWMANMDEGWTRWLFDHYGIRYRTLTDQEIRGGALDDVDVVVFASQSAQSIVQGQTEGRMPDAFTGGLGEAGVAALTGFVEAGGRVVALDSATDLLIRHFDIPVGNALTGLRRQDFYIPGSLVGIRVDENHPVGYGMPTRAAAFFQDSRAFEVVDAGAEVVARYASANVLLSGWEVGAEEHLAGRPAVVRVDYGAGDLVLIGFRAQFRAQPAGTFKLLFNSVAGARSRDPDVEVDVEVRRSSPRAAPR